jgi:type I site-specific restriction endonuclease
MIATGTDIKPLECVVFMRSVKSRGLFEQMKGRGVRVIPDADLQAVTPGMVTKTHFVIVDCVGVTTIGVPKWSLRRVANPRRSWPRPSWPALTPTPTPKH